MVKDVEITVSYIKVEGRKWKTNSTEDLLFGKKKKRDCNWKLYYTLFERRWKRNWILICDRHYSEYGHILIYLIFTTSVPGRYAHPHCTAEETESQSSCIIEGHTKLEFKSYFKFHFFLLKYYKWLEILKGYHFFKHDWIGTEYWIF